MLHGLPAIQIRISLWRKKCLRNILKRSLIEIVRATGQIILSKQNSFRTIQVWVLINLAFSVWRKCPEIYWQWVSDTQVRNYLVTSLDWKRFRSKDFLFSLIHYFSVTGAAISTVKTGGLFFWGIITKATLSLMMLRVPENARVKTWEL